MIMHHKWKENKPMWCYLIVTHRRCLHNVCVSSICVAQGLSDIAAAWKSFNINVGGLVYINYDLITINEFLNKTSFNASLFFYLQYTIKN